MNTENNIAAQMHTKTIDLQAVIIANQQQDIDRLNSLAIDSAAEADRLNKVIEWLQGQTGKMMGAAAKAEAVTLGPILMGDERVAERRTGERLAEILAEYRNGERELPSYAELRELCHAASAAPSEQAEPQNRNATLEEVALWYGDKGWLLDEDDVPTAIRALATAAPAAPLPELTGPSAFLRAAKDFAQAHIDSDELEDCDDAESSDESIAAVQASHVIYNSTKAKLLEAYRALAASPSPAPAQQPANLADALDRIALLHENNPEASLDDKASLLAHACTIARVTLALVTAPAKQQEPARIEITINGRQLRDALEAAWTERSDPDEGDTELTLFVRDKAEVSVEGETMEPGLWFYWTDYPEEGVCYLDPNAPETSVSESVEPAAPGSSTEGKQ